MRRLPNLAGERYGRLVVESQEVRNGKTWLTCVCDCGRLTNVAACCVRRGHTKSCGCLHGKAGTHYMSDSRVYSIWLGLFKRCYNKKEKSYHDYGGRGITVCKRWHKFENFILDMGEPPAGMSIERTNNNKGYSSSNCRWATKKEQNRNSRHNHNLRYKGVSRCMSEWAEILGMNYSTLRDRISRGWDVNRSFETPINNRGYK